MKPKEIYQHLIELAEKLRITVTEQNMRVTGVNAKSGLCKVRGQQIYVMDKHLSIHEKVEALASCLSGLPVEDIYIIPAIRNKLEKYR